MKVTRRTHLAAMGSALLAAGGSLSADTKDHPDDDDAEVLYGHGQVWNRDLPGVAGELKLAFDLRVNMATGTGFGTAQDPVFPDWNVHFAIESAERARLRRGESQFMMRGVVSQANNAALIGQPVRIAAQTRGDATAIAIAIGDLGFSGAGLVVLAIIGVLISLLLPVVVPARP
jgi:hypothetical protein